VVINYIGGKSWAGVNRMMTRQGTTAYMPDEDRALVDRLAAQAWQEDPRPLSHPCYSDNPNRQGCVYKRRARGSSN